MRLRSRSGRECGWLSMGSVSSWGNGEFVDNVLLVSPLFVSSYMQRALCLKCYFN